MTTVPTHIVLGGSGVVGRETVRALLDRGETPASVARRPASNGGAVSVSANLLDPAEVLRALRGAEVAYLTVGLPYSSRVWAKQWPAILRNTIDAAVEHGTHLVYFDNVYAYGRVSGPMTETTAINPSSKKGEVRAAALRALKEATARGLTVTVARSADFYGPSASTSVFNSFALDNIAAGKDATWLFDADQPHSLTYTPDIGDALATLGTDARARGGTWHVPTAPALTGRQYIELAAESIASSRSGKTARTKVMGNATMRIGALFNSSARETLEMAYQYTAPYLFDSAAFETTFGITATPSEKGIAVSLAATRT
ncbi:nucleoside-diphosphate-sugar epimerase [Glaciihabitans tibetensis]|uniref:Nucleoside-diphosphate-sugar epimerase n=1 Tax=Glaciihabitans tibetensis TaxID=1266600 RepID=A0A2T0VE27_9MICO|nr:NAD-dependent epimerase/dehydratase family protein [Glaciihabitans tibetensis]PRY68433.1 nucleoside-diphosphate-sugar epimerase [Glaciihabitans tibetensis]